MASLDEKLAIFDGEVGRVDEYSVGLHADIVRASSPLNIQVLRQLFRHADDLQDLPQTNGRCDLPALSAHPRRMARL
jgi:hypothetical protein